MRFVNKGISQRKILVIVINRSNKMLGYDNEEYVEQ